MIVYLSGPIVQKDPSQLIIECNGIGYQVKISLYTFEKVKDLDKVKIHTHFQVREDAQILYGFFDLAEKELFEQLINISGVGGNTTMVMLSSLSPEELFTAIRQENTAVLKSVKGIGAKTAGRIILELKDKLKLTADLPEASLNTPSVPSSQVREEALTALASLGLPKSVMAKRVDQILKKGDGNLTSEEIIKLALRNQ